MAVRGQLHTATAWPLEKNPVSWNRRLSGIKGWSGDLGEEKKSLGPAENRIRDCQASSLLILPATVTLFAHWEILAHVRHVTTWQLSLVLHTADLTDRTQTNQPTNQLHAAESLISQYFLSYLRNSMHFTEHKGHCHVHKSLQSTPPSYLLKIFFTLLMPNVNYSGRTAPLTSKVAFYIFIQQI